MRAPLYRKIVQIALPFVAALVVVSVGRASAQAAEISRMLVIPASDGYGFDDCLSGGKACGRTIADAWCEAHGMSASISFGRAEDVTASVPKAIDANLTAAATPIAAKIEAGPKFAPGSYIVNCTD